MERTGTVKPDGINAALWALSGYDLVLSHFCQLRRELMRPSTFDKEASLASVDRALLLYMGNMCAELTKAASITDAPIGIKEAFDKVVSEVVGDDKVTRTMYQLIALSGQDAELAGGVTSYAVTLTVLGSYGTAPWVRFAGAVEDLFFEAHPRLAGVS